MSVPTVGSISASVTSQILLAANSHREEAIIQNNSSAPLYITYGATAASPVVYTAKLYTDDVLTTTTKQQINGVFGAATGSALVTEVS